MSPHNGPSGIVDVDPHCERCPLFDVTHAIAVLNDRHDLDFVASAIGPLQLF